MMMPACEQTSTKKRCAWVLQNNARPPGQQTVSPSELNRSGGCSRLFGVERPVRKFLSVFEFGIISSVWKALRLHGCHNKLPVSVVPPKTQPPTEQHQQEQGKIKIGLKSAMAGSGKQTTDNMLRCYSFMPVAMAVGSHDVHPMRVTHRTTIVRIVSQLLRIFFFPQSFNFGCL